MRKVASPVQLPAMRSNMYLINSNDAKRSEDQVRVKALRNALVDAASLYGIEADDISDLDAVCARAVRVATLRAC